MITFCFESHPCWEKISLPIHLGITQKKNKLISHVNNFHKIKMKNNKTIANDTKEIFKEKKKRNEKNPTNYQLIFSVNRVQHLNFMSECEDIQLHILIWVFYFFFFFVIPYSAIVVVKWLGRIVIGETILFFFSFCSFIFFISFLFFFAYKLHTCSCFLFL